MFVALLPFVALVYLAWLYARHVFRSVPPGSTDADKLTARERGTLIAFYLGAWILSLFNLAPHSVQFASSLVLPTMIATALIVSVVWHDKLPRKSRQAWTTAALVFVGITIAGFVIASFALSHIH